MSVLNVAFCVEGRGGVGGHVIALLSSPETDAGILVRRTQDEAKRERLLTPFVIDHFIFLIFAKDDVLVDVRDPSTGSFGGFDRQHTARAGKLQRAVRRDYFPVVRL